MKDSRDFPDGEKAAPAGQNARHGANMAWGGLHLCTSLGRNAANHQNAILPGCTPFQPAQPVSLAQHLLAYASMFRRDYERIGEIIERISVSPLGAAALAGTTYPVDPRFVAEKVGFRDIYSNSMDAVSDRDFVLEALFAASLVMMHLSRLCEEIIIWSNPAFGFVGLPDDYSTGSSIMPQKRNPDVADLTRGKEGFLDASSTVSSSLSIMAAMLGHLHFNTQKMRQACGQGFLNATEFADYLVSKGIPFREAHHAAGKAVSMAEKRGVDLESLSLDDLKSISPVIEDDIYRWLPYEAAVQRRNAPGGTGPESVKAQLAELDKFVLRSQGG